MSLSDSQIRKIARLTFEKAYSYSQLAFLVNASYQEVYSFFRSKRSQELFITAKPWIEVLDICDPALSQGKKKYYKKLVRNPEVLVRLSPTGFDLISARAKLKPEFCSGKAPKNQYQKKLKQIKKEKLIFKKLNYPQYILRALTAGKLDPSDLPSSRSSGSSKYFSFLHGTKENILPYPAGENKERKEEEPEDLEEGRSEKEEIKKELPSSWLLSSMMDNFLEEEGKNNYDTFGFNQEEEELIDLPYSQDRIFDLYSRDMYKKFDPFKFGKCSPERFQAILKLLKANVKNFGYTVEKKDSPGDRIFIPANQELKEECTDLFTDYLERTTNERLILMPKNDVYGAPLLKPNANRFNNEEKRIDARVRFENIFGDAGKKYKSAVMLTLTSGQWHNNIFDDSRAFQENFNKLMTRLRKEIKDNRINDLIKKNPQFLKTKMIKNYINIPEDKLMNGSPDTVLKQVRKDINIHNKLNSSFRNSAKDYLKNDNNLKLPYLCVREFQKNGNIHYHIIIFGISWLKNNDAISNIWREYGQGKITKINKIGFDQERGYIWASGQAPEDSKGRQPLEYLKKYLLKGQYAEKNPEASLLYWVFNSRFFTYSSSLLSDEHKPRPYISKNMYVYFGVCYAGFWMDNGDTLICLDVGDPPG